MDSFATGLVIAMFLVAPGASAQQKADPSPPERPPGWNDTWYAQTFATSGSSFSLIHYWSKGRKLRSESVFAGQPITTIVSGDTYYTINRLTGAGIGIARTQEAIAEDRRGGRPFGNELEELKAAGGEKIGTEKVGALEAEIWRVTDRKGKRKIWATSDDHPVPIRIESFHRKLKKEGALSYANWLFGLDIPDSFFEPGPEIRVQRMKYDEYMGIALKGPVGPAPVLYKHLLHGPSAR